MFQAESILIIDDWEGLAFSTPIRRHYTLTRRDDLFRGEAYFEAGAYRNIMSGATVELSVPASVVEQFLAALAGTPFETGSYADIHGDEIITDDDPERRLTISQGDHVFELLRTYPQTGKWRLTSAGHELVVDGNTRPDHALDALTQHLRPEVYESVVDTVWDAWDNPPPATRYAGPAPGGPAPTATGR